MASKRFHLSNGSAGAKSPARTTGKPHSLSMAEILKNIELRGSTMGSFEEFEAAIAFIDKHKIRPIVFKTVEGLDKADEVLSIMKNGDQFGRLAIRIVNSDQKSKL